MPKVLIADDQPEIRRICAMNLAARKYEVIEAVDGNDCLSKIDEEKPDLILLDLAMPELSGWEVLEALNQGAVTTSAPVVIVTGWADEDIEAQSRALGAVGILVKPFGIDELLLTIDKALAEAVN